MLDGATGEVNALCRLDITNTADEAVEVIEVQLFTSAVDGLSGAQMAETTPARLEVKPGEAATTLSFQLNEPLSPGQAVALEWTHTFAGATAEESDGVFVAEIPQPSIAAGMEAVTITVSIPESLYVHSFFPKTGRVEEAGGTTVRWESSAVPSLLQLHYGSEPAPAAGFDTVMKVVFFGLLVLVAVIIIREMRNTGRKQPA